MKKVYETPILFDLSPEEESMTSIDTELKLGVGGSDEDIPVDGLE